MNEPIDIGNEYTLEDGTDILIMNIWIDEDLNTQIEIQQTEYENSGPLYVNNTTVVTVTPQDLAGALGEN